jgi:hypothetical protein
MVKTENQVTTIETFFNFRNETAGALRYQEMDDKGNIKKGDMGGAVIDALYLRKAALGGKVMKRFKVTITELT